VALPSIQGFPSCCGANIVLGFFTSDPRTVSGYKLSENGYGYALDKDGERMPLTFADKFIADMEREKNSRRSFAWYAVLNEMQVKSFDGEWTRLLKKVGFQSIRRWCNYNHGEREFLYLFALVTDYKGMCKGDFSAPPKGWDNLSTDDAKPGLLASVTAKVRKRAKTAA
jgi:hypothetical protein